jgi:hypothetical protein
VIGLPVALAVSPARVAVVAPAARALELRNVGATRVAVDVGRRRGANGWVSIRPAHLMLGAGARRVLTLRVGPGRAAGAGDHELRVFLIARPVGHASVAVRVRLGIRVRIRVPGRIVRRLLVRGLHVRRHAGRRVLLVSLANRGNVAEQLRGHVTVTLVRGGRLLSRLRPRTNRELLPGARTMLALPYAGGARGLVTAIVTVRPGAQRRYRLRL